MMLRTLTILCCLSLSISSYSQTDEEVIKKIYSTSLSNGQSYDWLNYLSNQIGGRLSGSLNAEKAVAWGKEQLDSLGLTKVWLQPVMVPKWVRGAKEYAYIQSVPGKTTTVNICALGGSVATPALGIKANVVEVHDFEELAALGEQIIVRSMNLRLDDYPHTGNMHYGDLPENQRIPAAAISTNDAELLSTMLELDKNIQFYFKQSCKQLKDVQSYNVIGEITGSEFPNDYMVVGGHLDSWDLGDGSHDDGAGIVQSMEVLRLFKKLGIKPKHSLRVVLFMNEENGLRGGIKYAEEAKQKGENHVFALESDSGGFTPRGFSFECNDAVLNKVQDWKSLFKPYLIHYFEKGHSGSDIGPLKTDTNVLVGLAPDSQRYFDYHHTKIDTFDAIDKRELELGAATMASLVYLFDKYGVK